MPGSTCLNGNPCVVPGNPLQGECPLRTEPLRCGGTTCKLDEVCCWDSLAGRGACAPRRHEGGATSCDTEFELHCGSPKACEPYKCYVAHEQRPNRWPEHYLRCGEPHYPEFSDPDDVICASDKDCPPEQRCFAAGVLPMRLRFCRVP